VLNAKQPTSDSGYLEAREVLEAGKICNRALISKRKPDQLTPFSATAVRTVS
jgi:hypothetical protein